MKISEKIIYNHERILEKTIIDKEFFIKAWQEYCNQNTNHSITPIPAQAMASGYVDDIKIFVKGNKVKAITKTKFFNNRFGKCVHEYTIYSFNIETTEFKKEFYSFFKASSVKDETLFNYESHLLSADEKIVNTHSDHKRHGNLYRYIKLYEVSANAGPNTHSEV